MSNTKTEAQRLADWLDADACDLLTPREAAAELRRLDAENDTLHKTIDSLTAQLRDYAGLKAARLAYASEFCFDKDGEPDIGSIHRNIRLLKAERDQLRAQLAKAVAEEREACAELMEQQHTWITNIAASAAIRARRTP